MTLRRIVGIAAVMLVACGPRPAPTPPTHKPGGAVPHAHPRTAGSAADQPTLRLPRTFLPTRYAAHLVIDPAAPDFTGTIAITGTLAQPSDVIWLNSHGLTMLSATATRGTETVELTATPIGEEYLRIAAPRQLAAGEWTLTIAYGGQYDLLASAGVFKQVVGGQPYVYTQFEAVYARRAFPCFDEPDNKVPWQLTLDVPSTSVAVSNTLPQRETPAQDGRKQISFAETKPLPSYLVAFGVGPFEMVDAGTTRSGTPVRIIALAKRAADAAFAASNCAKILQASEDWFGIPYPYGKLDILTIPQTLGFGAMENPGLITFVEGLVLLDPKASLAAKRSWTVVAAHEIAHQWFGDLVTTGWWDDIWLNEGFANWMESKTAAAVDPSLHARDEELETRNVALDADSLVTARQIRQPIETADDILNAFDGITYDKGASVLGMFESYIGPDVFQGGVRTYLKAHADGTATSAEFAAEIAKAAARPELAEAFATFLDQPGAPEITAALSCGKDGPTALLAQQRYVAPGAASPGATKPWMVPVCVAFDSAGKRAQACTLLTRPTGTLALPTKRCPHWIMANATGRGYYRTTYTAAQLTALRDEAWDLLQPVERRAVFFDARNLVERGRIPLALGLSLVPRMLAGNDQYTVPPALSFANWSDWVTDALRPKFEYYLQQTFGAAARSLGFVEQPTETIDEQEIRSALVGTMAWTGRDPELVASAVTLAEHWRDLPQSIRGLVLEIAVDASPAWWNKIAATVTTEPDRLKRREMYRALGGVRDVKLQQRALAFVLDPRTDIRETMRLVFGATTEATRASARAWFAANEAAVIARSPKDGSTFSLGDFAEVFTSACDASQRDQIAAYVTAHFSRYAGAERVVRQAIEEMDQCIARRALVQPALDAWLGGIRIVKDPGDKPAAVAKPAKPAKNKKKPRKAK